MTSDRQSLITEPTPSRHRWLKFSLRSLFVFITLVACFLSWPVYEWSQSKFERQIGEKLQEQGCFVEFHGIYDRPFPRGTSPVLRNQQGWWRDLARQLLGERIWSVRYRGGPENLLLLPGLSNLKQLRFFHGVLVSDLTPLAELKTLETLQLEDWSRSIDDLTPLAGPSNLKQLSFHCSSVSDLKPLAKLKKLEMLNLRVIDMSLDDLTPLAELKNLQWLMLADMSLDDLTPLAELKKLERLSLASMSLDDLMPLAELKKLKGLELDVRSVSDPLSIIDFTPLAKLKTLETLRLTGMSFDDLTPLAELNNLKEISLLHSSVSDEQVESLQQALPNCRIFVR